MADKKYAQAQLNFNAGQVSEYYTSRVDMEKYQSALTLSYNFLPRLHGSLRRRPGTKALYEFDTPIRMINMRIGADKEFLLCVHSRDVESTTAPYVAIFDTKDISGEGDLAPVAVLTGLDNSDTAIPRHRPYKANELRLIQYASQNDIMVLCQQAHCPMVIKHAYDADGNDTFEWYRFIPTYPPLSDIKVDDTQSPAKFWRWDDEAGSYMWGISADTPIGYMPEITELDVGAVFYADIAKVHSESMSEGESSSLFATRDFPIGTTSFNATTYNTWKGILEIWQRYPHLMTYENRFDLPPYDRLFSVTTRYSANSRNFIVTGTSINRSYITSTAEIFDGTYSGYVTSENTWALNEPFRLVRTDDGMPFRNNLWINFTTISWYKSAAGTRLQVRKFTPSAWSDKLGWPRCVTFRDGRLWFASTYRQPQTIWASEVDNYDNFLPGSGADSPIDVTLGSNNSQAIMWLNSGKNMLVGTDMAEWVLVDSTTDNPIPTIAVQSEYGSAPLAGLTIAESAFYVTRDGKGLQQAIYDFGIDGYSSENLTIIAGDISKGGFTAVAVQKEPDPIWWGVTKEGTLAGLLYNRQQNIYGWHTHAIDGGLIDDMAVYRKPGDQTESLAFSVKRGTGYVLEAAPEENDCLDMQSVKTLDDPAITCNMTDFNARLIAQEKSLNPDLPLKAWCDGRECEIAETTDAGVMLFDKDGGRDWKLGVPVKSQFISLPMGSYSQYIAPATTTQIVSFNYELLWTPGEFDKTSPIIGSYDALKYDNDAQYDNAPQVPVIKQINNGRGRVNLNGRSCTDTRLTMSFDDYKKVTVLSVYIFYTSNAIH